MLSTTVVATPALIIGRNCFCGRPGIRLTKSAGAVYRIYKIIYIYILYNIIKSINNAQIDLACAGLAAPPSIRPRAYCSRA